MKTTATEDGNDSEFPALGALILAIFALFSLITGALMTWMSVSVINKLFKVDDPMFITLIMATWTGVIFAMTPTFGNARRVKAFIAKFKTFRIPFAIKKSR